MQLEQSDYEPVNVYPPLDERRKHRSEGFTSYFVDPNFGDDLADGLTLATAWRTFQAVNRMLFAPGDTVIVLPGFHHFTLMPFAIGTAEAPVTVCFKTGAHIFTHDSALRRSLYVSNASDKPEVPRPIGILIENCTHFNICGEDGTDLLYRDRMVYFVNSKSKHVQYTGLSFDMLRPTVSEFRVHAVSNGTAAITISDGSEFRVDAGRFEWVGDIGEGWTMVQEAIPAEGRCWRLGQYDPFKAAIARSVGGRNLELQLAAGPRLVAGHQYQFRRVTRDNVTACNMRCTDVRFQDVNFFAMPGMGIVSQFTDSISFVNVNVMPRPGTDRTCPAWADCFHFSGCKGHVKIEGCRFNGTQDDPINVHGTHLRLQKAPGQNCVEVRYMHDQTYGFAPYERGDHIAFVDHKSLMATFEARVLRSEQMDLHTWRLELDRKPAAFAPGDVADNTTWYPEVTIRNCDITMDSCRGILTTSRGKTRIENVTFRNTTMTAIDIADDANSWFESGAVQDLTIRNCRFIRTGDPAISIHPETSVRDLAKPVHHNIRIEECVFETDSGIYARCVSGLRVHGCTFKGKGQAMHTESCTRVDVGKMRKAEASQ